MIDFFNGFCIDDTDLQEITITEVGITKTEVADFLLLYKYKSLTIYLNRPSDLVCLACQYIDLSLALFAERSNSKLNLWIKEFILAIKPLQFYDNLTDLLK